MTFSIVVAAITVLVMITGVLFFPVIRLGKLKIDCYWVIALLGASVMLLSGSVDADKLIHALTDNSAINPIKILVLFISMTVLSIFLDEVGFFRYLANKALSLARKSQLQLFVVLYITVSVLTVFTSNDIIVLTFTPFICYFAKNANISPVPYLVGEFVAANTMSMTFIIGNPTNIYIATSYGINFFDYFTVMLLPTLTASLVAFFILLLLFKKQLSIPASAMVQDIKIQNKTFLIIGLCDLIICTVLLAIGSYIGLDMWIVSLAAALLLYIVIAVISLIKRSGLATLGKTAKRAPWQLVPFVLSMFVIILAMQQNGVTATINNALGNSHTILSYGASSFFAANLINNIPMSVLFCPIIQPLEGASQMQAVYATVVGSNLGAYLTPIGALAGIMWMGMLKEHEVKFGYADFMKYGFAVAIPTLIACLAVLDFVV